MVTLPCKKTQLLALYAYIIKGNQTFKHSILLFMKRVTVGKMKFKQNYCAFSYGLETI